MTRRTRKRLATGIYKDRSGIAIVISVQGVPREFRNQILYASKDLQWLRSERIRLQAAETLKAERETAQADTFAADVPPYLQTIASVQYRRDCRRFLALWSAQLGDKPRNAITPIDVQTVFATFDHYAPATRNHLRGTLLAFYNTLNGPHGYNPAHTLKRHKNRTTEPRALSYDVIEKIFAALQPSRAKARLQVMAYTGLPQSLIAKMRPSDLHLDRRELLVHPRRKGAGVHGKMLPLSPAGVAALREFQRLNAFGSFQNRQLTATWRYGAKLAGVTLPDGVRPYDLRHSFLTEVYRQTGDLHAVSELGIHATLEQTARYARGAATERATKAVTAVPRFRATTAPRKSSKSVQIIPAAVRSPKRVSSPRKRKKSPRLRS